MTTPPQPTSPSPFAGVADSYHRFRPGIPADVADVLTGASPRRRPRRLLDLATGTGQVVRAMAARFDDVLAVEPDPAMAHLARTTLAAEVPDLAVTVVESPAETFEAPAGWAADLVTISRAFHWFDRPTVLRRLEPVVRPGGVIAIFSEPSFWEYQSDWTATVRGTVQEFLGPRRRAGRGTSSAPRRTPTSCAHRRSAR
ncbi:class I SAM-dependent methyltransferase [Antribacter sp. KLBMP9083]|uniref:Class I SAM-dependent methyltransferase n=1 Tax=Antribacter soli TaxID=2910976 RepID=A0AA41QF56_9MICO|nr:class I SAM-dependent methyltransferase [Antribacter soli]MCF4122017.1 class I SAM-dependent methyltransferase [Antribacter soli]